MKRLTERRGLCAVLAAVGYLLMLALGVGVISWSPVRGQQSYLMRNARTVAEDYAAGDLAALEAVVGPNTRILVYAADGTELLHLAPVQRRGSAPRLPVERYIAAAMEGRELFRLAFSRETERTLPDILTVSVVPLTLGGERTGAVMLAKNMFDLPEALIAFFCYFTVLYWLCAYLLLSNARRKERLERTRQEYIANVTHALKTPISSVRMLAEALCDGVVSDPDKQQVYYGLILQESAVQYRMVQEILELSRLQSRNTDFTRTAVDAEALLRPVLESYALLCDCTDVALEVDGSVYALPTLWTNAACVRQIMEILLDNAVKFVPAGGTVRVSAAVSGRTATLCVRDNGAGIAPEDLPHIFERFYRCARGDAQNGGSGLGLAIARETARGLGERIWAESEPGRGCAFYFTLRVR